jgi:hypothetical protein
MGVRVESTSSIPMGIGRLIRLGIGSRPSTCMIIIGDRTSSGIYVKTPDSRVGSIAFNFFDVIDEKS